jgi:hypothetical protein
MKIVAASLALLLVLALPATALALATEAFGNDPMVKQPDWAEGVVDVVNLKSRVYTVWVNGNESFYYRGNARDLNEAIAKFTAVHDGVRELILLPGPPAARKSFEGKMVDYDWMLHVPSGIYKAMTKREHATLTVYVRAPNPRPLDRKRVEQWLPGLGSDSFKAREQASQELQKLGKDAKPILREALKAEQSPEARRRLEALLERVQDVDVTDLVIPKGVTVVTVDDQLAAHMKGMQSPDRNVRSTALQDLAGLAPYSDKVVSALSDALKKDEDNHVRRVAAGCLSHLPVGVRAAEPVLKAGLDDPDAYIREACKTALGRLDGPKDAPVQVDETRAEILKDINGYKKPDGPK